MDTASIAVWDVPLPVIAGVSFRIKVGVKSQACTVLTGSNVEVCDARGQVVASGKLGGEPWSGTDALYWVELSVPAPASSQLAEFTVRFGNAASRFSVAAVRKPEHRLAVRVTEQATQAPLSGVEIRLDAFHARTDQAGCADVVACNGEYQLLTRLAGHQSEPTPIEITGDSSIEVTMVHVPEEHPDARWVR